MAIAERLTPAETVAQRIEKYFPSPEVLRDYPHPLVLERQEKENQENELPGCSLALVTSRLPGGRQVIVPYNHPENSFPSENPGTHYSHVAFEGISFVPEVDSGGQIVGANLILFKERMQRFRNSIRALGGAIPPESQMMAFEEGLKFLASVEGERVLRDKNGKATRAYLRPAYLRLGKFSVAPKPDARYSLTGIFWNWALYKSQEVYDQGAVAIAFLDTQRNEPIYGKLAGNYVHGGVLTQTVEEYLGGNEVLYLGPYIINQYGAKEYINSQGGEIAKDRLLKYGMPVDGSGEDLIFEGWNGTIYLQPKDTNILGGTTREYIKEIAKRLGITVEERCVTFELMRKGEITGMTYVGNAVNALEVKIIQVYNSWKPEGQLVDTIELKITPQLRRLRDALELELTHQIEPSHSGLLTPIDLPNGKLAREKLARIFPGWLS